MNVTLSVDTRSIARAMAEVRRRQASLAREAPELMDSAGIALMEQVSELSPFDTGFMSSHVTYTPLNGRTAFTVGWHEEEFTAAGHYPYYLVQEFGSVQQPDPQPSLGPVARQALPDLKKDLESLMRREMVRR